MKSSEWRDARKKPSNSFTIYFLTSVPLPFTRIISSDKDLLELSPFKTIPITTPDEFIRQLKSEEAETRSQQSFLWMSARALGQESTRILLTQQSRNFGFSRSPQKAGKKRRDAPHSAFRGQAGKCSQPGRCLIPSRETGKLKDCCSSDFHSEGVLSHPADCQVRLRRLS
jgi:hypothetical protein